MNYYHKDEIEILESCPPQDYVLKNCECFRWVFEDINDSRNFKSQAEKNPKLLNSKSDLEKCEIYALSFHDNLSNSKTHFNLLLKKFKNIKKTLGTNIAQGNLTNLDGKGGKCDSIGHFNFHFVKKHDFENKFKIVDTL